MLLLCVFNVQIWLFDDFEDFRLRVDDSLLLELLYALFLPFLPFLLFYWQKGLLNVFHIQLVPFLLVFEHFVHLFLFQSVLFELFIELTLLLNEFLYFFQALFQFFFLFLFYLFQGHFVLKVHLLQKLFLFKSLQLPLLLYLSFIIGDS